MIIIIYGVKKARVQSTLLGQVGLAGEYSLSLVLVSVLLGDGFWIVVEVASGVGPAYIM